MPGKDMSSTGEFAAVLRASTDEELVRGLELRGFAADGTSLGGIRDFFDLADALLEHDALHYCLERLERDSLLALTRLSEASGVAGGSSGAREQPGIDEAAGESLRQRFLVRDVASGATGGQTAATGLTGMANSAHRPVAWPEVTAWLTSWRAPDIPDYWEQQPEPGEPASQHTNPSDHANSAVDALAAERAFTATITMAELLHELERAPVRVLTTGALGRQEARRLTELLRVDEPRLTSLLGMAELAGLAQRRGRQLVASDAHHDWLEQGTAQRWSALAEAWVRAHWTEIRVQLARRRFAQDDDLTAWLHWVYPAGQGWLAHTAVTWVNEAELLGLVAHGDVSSAGAKVLNNERGAAERELASRLPAPVQRLYLQHDLTAVATGPLDARIDARLRELAETDGHALASRYRFTAASIAHAIAGGETEQSLLEFLEEISLSGIPQPLDYLIKDTASRHGLLRVGSLPGGSLHSADQHAASYLRSTDNALLRTVLVDRELAALRLRNRDSGTIVSAVAPGVLFAALREANYPVALEDAEGRVLRARPSRAASATAHARSVATPKSPHQLLIDRLRLLDAEALQDADEAWFARQLDAAIRSKAEVNVSVRMPNGELVDYRLEPISVSRGRLRARDPQAEIERTLPLASIARVQRG